MNYLRSTLALLTALSVAGCASSVTTPPSGQAPKPTQNFSGDLYVTTKGFVYIFSLGCNPKPVYTIANPTGSFATYEPGALAFDNLGNAYIANNQAYAGGGNSTVEVWQRSKLVLQIANGVSHPVALAVDQSAHLYVANAATNSVSVYLPQTKTPTQIIFAGVSGPNALAVDGSGNLYVSNGTANTVTVYTAGSTAVARTISTGISNPSALAVDTHGNLYVANAGANDVTVYAPGSTSVMETIASGVANPSALAYSAGSLFVANRGIASVQQSVTAYNAPGSTSISGMFTSGIATLTAIFVAYGVLYVANAGGKGTVTEYDTGSGGTTCTLTIGNPPAGIANAP